MGSAVTPLPNKEAERKVGFVLLAIYLFLIFSRVQEYLAMATGTGFFLSLIFGLLALITSLVSGTVLRGFTSRQGVYLLIFTGWLLNATALSTWKGGSVDLLTQFWFKSLITFVLTAALITTLDMSKKAMYVVAAACLVAEVAVGLLAGNHDGRFELTEGTLANANGLAFHVMVALPFLYLLMLEGTFVGRVVAGLGLAYGTLVVIRTGSRSGLIQLGIILVLVFVRLRASRKILLAVSAAFLFVFGLMSLPPETLDRYKTLFSGGTPSSESGAYESAVESQNSRLERLETSLETTREHPFFGVGPGVFASATAEEETREGRTARWRQTHNAYTQLSAEAGIPALLLYLAAIGTCLKAAISVYLSARRRQEATCIANMSYCLTLSLLVFSLNAITDSNAYQYYFPFLAGLTFAFTTAAKQVLEERHPVLAARPQEAPAPVSMLAPMPAPMVKARPRALALSSPAIRAPGGSGIGRKLNAPRV